METNNVNIFDQGNINIKKLHAYPAGTSIEDVVKIVGKSDIIKLASNENPLGYSPKVKDAILEALPSLNIYPNASYSKLTAAIAEYSNCDSTQISVGNGSENCIEILIKAFLDASSTVIISQYCFLTIINLIKAAGASFIEVPTKDFRHDIESTLSSITANTKMIFVVNPANPTGTYTTYGELIYLMKNTPKHIIVVVDEAYYEYVENDDYPNCVALLSQYPNLVISRTFSKGFGLAGIRLGYLISNPQITELIVRAKLPFNVNSLATTAGISALSDSDFLDMTRYTNISGMKQLIKGIKNLGLEFIPSVGNFITINVNKSAHEVYQKMLMDGVIIRPLAPYKMDNFIRITIGTFEQNQKALDTLSKALS